MIQVFFKGGGKREKKQWSLGVGFFFGGGGSTIFVDF